MMGILTFYWADDYGAMLQAYGLKQYLEKNSKNGAEIIPYAPLKLEGRYRLLPITGKEKKHAIQYSFRIEGLIRNAVYLRDFLKRRKNMRDFRRRYLTGKAAVKRAGAISLETYSAVFVGSDQVWNPEITVGLDDVYLGNIKRKGNCRLIAYGASFGGNSLPDRYHAGFVKAIRKNFWAVSLREQGAVPFVKGFFPGKVTDVADPALLLEREEWEKIGKLPSRKDYILLIAAEYNRFMIRYLRRLSAEWNKEVIQISMPGVLRNEKWITLEIGGGPSEFIGFVQNAACVVTNSFHGTVFSVLMEKQFLVFSHSNKNARMENLLEKLELKTRMIESGIVPSAEEMRKTADWKHVKELLEKERRRSAEFLKQGVL